MSSESNQPTGGTVIQFTGRAGIEQMIRPSAKSASFTYNTGSDLGKKIRINFVRSESPEYRTARILAGLVGKDKVADIKFANRGESPVSVTFPPAIQKLINEGSTGTEIRNALRSAAPSTSAAAAESASEAESSPSSSSAAPIVLGTSALNLAGITSDNLQDAMQRALEGAKNAGIFDQQILTAEVSAKNRNDMIVKIYELAADNKIFESRRAKLKDLAGAYARNEVTREQVAETLAGVLAENAADAERSRKQVVPAITSRKKRIAALKTKN